MRIAIALWVLVALGAAAPYTTRFMRKQWIGQMCAAPYSKTDEYRLRHCIAVHKILLGL